MIARIWRTEVGDEHAPDYERFARENSLPMFRAQDGYRGVLMGRKGGTRIVVSLWRDRDAVTALDGSASYQDMVRDILAAGFLGEEQTVEAFDLHLADLPPNNVQAPPPGETRPDR